jgi:transaldolase/glucose-6-phosphate isomerase
MKPLIELHKLGQSVWLDNLSRHLVRSGELARLIQEDGLRGVTSNPTIFEKAISAGAEYDAAMKQLVAQGKSTAEIVDQFIIEDIQGAADALRPLYDASKGEDGYVSIEVAPSLARDTTGTIAEARRLWKLVNRPNIMVKIPGTREGLPAIQQMIADGANINVTLLFSVERYGEVIEAYLAGLEQRVKAGQPITHVASVASFFVSRVDTAIDKLLEAKGATTLMGKAAVANAKLAYQLMKQRFSGARWSALQAKGAQIQRVLWASTGTKNPKYSDVLYVEPLIGPHTVNTMPDATLAALMDHGKVALTVEQGAAEAQATFKALAAAGIDVARVTRELEEAAVKLFSDSFTQLMNGVEGKRQKLVAAGNGKTAYAAALGPNAARVTERFAKLDQDRFAQRLGQRDLSVWNANAAHQKVIQNRLGWVTVIEQMRKDVPSLIAFADEARQAGFTHAILMGMGGSSLFPDVCRITFGVKPGYVDVSVLDTTDPTSILAAQQAHDLRKTLFIVSTKAGTTLETRSLYERFADQLQALTKQPAGAQCIAITDPGSPLEQLAKERTFRRVFLNPADIGGRYSALSYFGLVPAALLGVDLAVLLDRAAQMAQACQSSASAQQNPGVWLGAILAELARAGRNKVTFALAKPVASFGYWVEQLIAESTGKEGQGLIPVESEPLAAPAAYGADRVFVSIQMAGQTDAAMERSLQALEAAGHPVIRLTMHDTLDLGAECFRWEYATAVAGALLGIDPFDEPNVQESKDNTKALLETFIKTGSLPAEPPLLTDGSVALYGTIGTNHFQSLADALSRFLKLARPGDYAAILAYLPRTPECDQLLQAIRLKIRDAQRVATTLGYGPRFLHSTGQLHKGGPNTGLFIQLTVDDPQDVPIPGAPYTFGLLKQAQALGDLRSLQGKQRRAIRLHLGRDVRAGLQHVLKSVDQAIALVART